MRALRSEFLAAEMDACAEKNLARLQIVESAYRLLSELLPFEFVALKGITQCALSDLNFWRPKWTPARKRISRGCKSSNRLTGYYPSCCRLSLSRSKASRNARSPI